MLACSAWLLRTCDLAVVCGWRWGLADMWDGSCRHGDLIGRKGRTCEKLNSRMLQGKPGANFPGVPNPLCPLTPRYRIIGRFVSTGRVAVFVPFTRVWLAWWSFWVGSEFGVLVGDWVDWRLCPRSAGGVLVSKLSEFLEVGGCCVTDGQ